MAGEHPVSIHPEDAALYAQEQHDDLVRIAAALERLGDILGQIADSDRPIPVRQAGAWITREDRP